MLWSDVPSCCTLAWGPDFICKDLKNRETGCCRPETNIIWDLWKYWHFSRNWSQSNGISFHRRKWTESYKCLKGNSFVCFGSLLFLYMWSDKLTLKRGVTLFQRKNRNKAAVSFCLTGCSEMEIFVYRHISSGSASAVGSHHNVNIQQPQESLDFHPDSTYNPHECSFLYHTALWKHINTSIDWALATEP